MGPMGVAAKGKGTLNLARRARDIGTRYGLGPTRMERRLGTVHEILERYASGATLPVTAAAALRNPRVVARYADLGIEFAVHGYYHVDHAALSETDQLRQLGRARELLEANGVPTVGFRAPYLRWNHGTLRAVRENGFLYDSSQAVHWPVDSKLKTDAYRRALGFCGAIPADEHPVLPWLEDGIVRIPYCLPDDESVVDRLRLASAEAIAELWLKVFRATHERGELFTLAVHPERIESCAPGIIAVLEAASSARHGVWIARLEQVARWWAGRTASTVSVRDAGAGYINVNVQGPVGVTVLVRGLEHPDGEPWADSYVRARETDFTVRSDRRPFIGVHPSSPASLAAFLTEQGYIVEVSEAALAYYVYLKRERFSKSDELPLLAELDSGASPLVRLARWPNGARSVLCITGDVDALTIWDYAFRFLRR